MEDIKTYIKPQYAESELTGILIGLSYEMWNRLGYGYQEKYFQRAYAQLLTQNKLPFEREQKVIIEFANKKIGRYFIDFVVKNTIVVELKVADDIYLQHIRQVLGYLKATGMKVGLLVIIAKKGIKIKRIINTPY